MRFVRSFTFFLLVCLALLVSLGTWQMMRRAEKAHLLETHSQALHRPSLNVDRLISRSFPHPIKAEGFFLKGKSVVLSAKTYKGNSGFYVLDVFKTVGGRFLLVQRGWSKNPSSEPPTGLLSLEGIGRLPSPPTYFQPPNTPPTYYWIDLDLLSRELSLPLLPYYMVAFTSFDPLILPTDPFPSLPNNHLTYALTWYSLALFLLGMLLYRRFRLTKETSLGS